MDLTLEEFGKLMLKFRKSRYFRPFYLVVLGIIVTGLYEFLAGPEVLVCLGILAMPVSAILFPYWAGERSLKNFAINALPIFVIALVLIATLQTQAVLDQGQVVFTTGYDPATKNVDLPKLSMWNGTVDPYRGGPNELYTFHVRLKEVNTTTGVVVDPQNVTTFSANITQYTPFAAGSEIVVPMAKDPARLSNTSNGTWYIGSTILADGVYSFYFWANDTTGNFTYAALPVLDPVVASPVAYYGFWLVNIAFYLTFPVSFYFILIFMYWYMIRMRKRRERAMDRVRGEKLDLEKGGGKGGTEEESKDAAAGAATDTTKDSAAAKTKKAAAFTCTNCGADVTEDDAKCPKCGAVFED